MTRTFLRSFALSSLLVAACASLVSADTITYTVSNFTASGGDPTYSVATDVTFNNLMLRETFADSTTSLVPLYDFTNAVKTSLDTLTLDLHSAALNTVGPMGGNLLSATLTGLFSQTSLSIKNSFGATPVPVTVNAAFSVTLPSAATSINILAVSPSGASWAAGTLESVTSPVPEPATGAIAALGLGSLLVLMRRLKGNRSL